MIFRKDFSPGAGHDDRGAHDLSESMKPAQTRRNGGASSRPFRCVKQNQRSLTDFLWTSWRGDVLLAVNHCEPLCALFRFA
jgi:hypothetical protein